MAPNWIIRFLALAFGACAAAFAQPTDPPAEHPYGASLPIPGRYIVVFKDHVTNPAATAANLMRGTGGQLHHTYSRAIRGFAATLPDWAVRALRNNPNVDYVEQDQTVSLNDTTLPEADTKSGGSWGQDRIDQRELTDDPLYLAPDSDHANDYHYHYLGGNVYAFIIDTGIRATHKEFQTSTVSRVKPELGFTAFKDKNGTNDCHGHGTHVAGTVGGLTWGVTKGVSLIPVRVLNCQGMGSWSDVLGGIDHVAKRTDLRPAVANMSLGGGKSDAVNTAVNNLANQSNVTVVVAAGNSSADACDYSPAGAKDAITVGATTIEDKRASYSNYGTCLDIFAPGSSITSAWPKDGRNKPSDTATKTISGTSMASPHVAGVAVLALAADPDKSPGAVDKLLKDSVTCLTGSSFGEGSTKAFVYSLLEVVRSTEPGTDPCPSSP